MGISSEVQAKRQAAAKARRLSLGISNRDDAKRLLAIADELDAAADDLEHESDTSTRLSRATQGRHADSESSLPAP
jgi:hypothetical protein